jgi:hypothetical protein
LSSGKLFHIAAIENAAWVSNGDETHSPDAALKTKPSVWHVSGSAELHGKVVVERYAGTGPLEKRA